MGNERDGKSSRDFSKTTWLVLRRSFAVQWRVPQLVEEVQLEGDAVPRLVLFYALGQHKRDNSSAIRREIVIPEKANFRQPFLGPQPRLVRDEGISLYRVPEAII